uniref:hypothetical protein n=1 Tax=uncultured Alistipes sp. TaxID=538949 RepID=UPI0025D821BE
GDVTSALDRLTANSWGWIAAQVICGDSEPKRAAITAARFYSFNMPTIPSSEMVSALIRMLCCRPLL